MNIELGEEKKEELRNWVEGNGALGGRENVGSMSVLFKGENGAVTWKLWIIWMVSAVVYYGIMLAMPLIVET